jgi:dihydrofolate synthase/folylpolyglutamate synthase
MLSFLYFKETKTEVIALECGLGGLLDSTNIIKNPLCSIITSIGLDHEKVLGDSLEGILRNKAGIIK